MFAPRHSFEDHTAEVRLRVEAPTLTALFEEAARGLGDLMLERAREGGEDSRELVEIHAHDRDALLVDWLNELVFLGETRQRVYTDVQVHRASETDLEATVCGVHPEVIRTQVKAATLSGLAIEESADGYRATIVLDV